MISEKIRSIFSSAVARFQQSKVFYRVGRSLKYAPGYNPHNITVSSDGVRRTIYGALFHEYNTNSAYSAPVDTTTDLLIGMGISFIPDDRQTQAEMDRQKQVWDDWTKLINFQDKYKRMTRSSEALGDGYGVIAKDKVPIGDSTLEEDAIIIQPLDPKRVWVQPAENNPGKVEMYYYFPYDPKKWSDLSREAIFSLVSEKKIEPIEPRDMIHFILNPLSDELYGRAQGLQGLDNLSMKKELLSIAAAMAYRQTHGVMLGHVDLSDKDHTKRTDEQTGKKTSEAQEELYFVRDLVEDRVKKNASTGQTDIYSTIMVEKGRVDIEVINLNADISGVNESTSMLQKDIDKQMKVPPILMGSPEGSNKASSVTELLGTAVKLHSDFLGNSAELERKLLPKLGIKGKLVVARELVTDDQVKYAAIAKWVGDLVVKLILTPDEARQIISDLMGLNLKSDKIDTRPLQTEEPEEEISEEPDEEPEVSPSDGRVDDPVGGEPNV